MVEEHRSADRGTADEVPGDGVVALVGVGGSHRSSPLFSERFAEGVNSNDPWALFQWVTMDRPNPSWEALEAIYSDQGPVLKSPPERSVASQRGPLGPEQMVQVLRCPDRGPVGGRRIRRATAQFQRRQHLERLRFALRRRARTVSRTTLGQGRSDRRTHMAAERTVA